LWVIRPHGIKGLKILQNNPLLGQDLNLISHEQKNVTFRYAFLTYHILSTKKNLLDAQPKDLGVIPGTGTIYVKPPIFPDWLWKPQSLLFKK
jgi:hypothetical protein